MTESREPRLASAAPLLVGTMIGSLVAGRIETGLLCLGIAVATGAVVGARWPARRWTFTVGVSMVVGWVLNLYLTPGAPLPASWPRVLGQTPTRDGALLGLLLALRLGGAVTALQGLRAVWPGERAADALARWLSPLERVRVPVREMRAMVGLSLRFAPLLEREARRIRRVQDLRAGRPPRGMGEWLQRRRAAAVPTLVGALERAERTALALEARGYRERPLRPAAENRSSAMAAIAGWSVAGVALLWRG
jgi:energy-coupling factor transporter transmembrane protein EcfT